MPTYDQQRTRWVTILATDAQEYVCSEDCARRAVRPVRRQETLRVAAETACCVVCRRYGTFPKVPPAQ